ncbi:MAG: tetratricopeptide repeat protein [Muricomes sp.]
MLLYKQGRFLESIPYFRRAIEKQTWKNPNPASGEAYFHLGLALVMCGNEEDAFDAFYKSVWCADTQSGGFYWLACLSARRGEYREALEFINQSLVRNWHNMKARTLKAALLRMLCLDNKTFIQESLDIDPLDFGLLYEQGLALQEQESWLNQMRLLSHNYLVLSLDYMKAGLYDDALAILSECQDPSPLIAYYQGYAWEMKKDSCQAELFYAEGEKRDYSKCFPNQPEEIPILEGAIWALSKAPRAHYYLGCLLYDKRQYQKAALHWEQALAQDPDFAMASRNLAIYFYNKENDIPKALEYMKNAFELEPTYSRFLQEYNQLMQKAAISNEEQLSLLSEHLDLVQSRDALYVEYIGLLNRTGQYDLALEHLSSHQFHPWEGGEGKVSAQYRYALIHKAIRLIERGDYDQAIGLLEDSKTYPHNLGEGKLPGTQDAMADYYIGKAYLGKQDYEASDKYFHMAVQKRRSSLQCTLL